jgi:hypothetical protein
LGIIGGGLLGAALGYHAPGEIAFEVITILGGSMWLFNYGFYSRILVSDDGIECLDVFWGSWWVNYESITEVDAYLEQGGKATAYILEIKWANDSVRVNMNNYRQRDMRFVVEAIARRASHVKMGWQVPEFVTF